MSTLKSRYDEVHDRSLSGIVIVTFICFFLAFLVLASELLAGYRHLPQTEYYSPTPPTTPTSSPIPTNTPISSPTPENTPLIQPTPAPKDPPELSSPCYYIQSSPECKTRQEVFPEEGETFGPQK